MEIQEIELDKLKPYKLNSKQHPETQIEGLAESIKRFGFTQPIVTDKENEIIIGHGRLEAAKRLGLKTVPCVKRSDLNDIEIKALRLIDNRIAETGWDTELLSVDLDEIDYDFESFNIEFDDLLIDVEPEVKGHTDPDKVPDNAPAICKLGDTWQLGNHRLRCGDSTDKEQVDLLMDGQKADMVFTDPPYGVDYSGRGKNTKKKIKNDNLCLDDLAVFIKSSLTRANEAAKDGAAAYVWHADSKVGIRPVFEAAFIASGWHLSSTIIWHKKQASMGWQDYRSQHEPCLYGFKEGQKHVFYGDRTNTTIWFEGRDSKYVHPTQKPTELCDKALKNSSKSGDLILDLFLGSGSTLIACEKTNRTCYGMELDPHYCDVIIKRWEDFTDKKAEILNG